MASHPRPGQGSGALSWSVSIDLTAMNDRQRVDAAADLLHYASLRHPRCRSTLRVGNLRPIDCDPRVEAFVAQALAAGVNLHLEGDMLAVGAWWRTLTEATSSKRRLQVVR